MSRSAANKAEKLVVDEITLDGRSVEVRSVDLSPDDLILDPLNPRIANTFAITSKERVHGAALQKKLEDHLWSDDDVRDLYRQVFINKGLIERIIVRQDGTVIEGNCRTVVYRKLKENHPSDPTWKRIPARMLPSDINDRDVAILLSEMHVAGKNKWTPFEKAGHVYKLHKDFALTQDEIAQRLRMSKSKVNQYIRAFDTMRNRFLPKYPQSANIRKFSHFEELYRIPYLRDWVESTLDAEERFIDWVGKGSLPQGAQVRSLPAILRDEEAVKALTNEGFAAAQRVMAEDNPTITSKLFQRMADMTEALKKAQLDDIQRVRRGGNPRAREITQELNKALGHFLELCGIDNR